MILTIVMQQKITKNYCTKHIIGMTLRQLKNNRLKKDEGQTILK